MKTRQATPAPAKGLSLPFRIARGALLGLALALLQPAGAAAQTAVDPPPFAIFQKEPIFGSTVDIATFDAALALSQTYREEAVGSVFDYSLEVALDGRSRVFNSISSVPFRPGGRLYDTTTILGADITDPEKALQASERFTFAACGETAGIGTGMGVETLLLRGKALSQVRVDSASKQFEGSYLGDGVGAVGIGVAVGSGSAAGSQSYNGSLRVEGDYRVSYSVSSGPSLSGGCLLGW